jgi:hypothetical protein
LARVDLGAAQTFRRGIISGRSGGGWANPASRDRVLGAPACRPLRPETRAGRRGAWAETALGRPARASALRVTPPFAVGRTARWGGSDGPPHRQAHRLQQPDALGQGSGHWSLDTVGCRSAGLAGGGSAASFCTVKMSSLSKSLQGGRLRQAPGPALPVGYDRRGPSSVPAFDAAQSPSPCPYRGTPPPQSWRGETQIVFTPRPLRGRGVGRSPGVRVKKAARLSTSTGRTGGPGAVVGNR